MVGFDSFHGLAHCGWIFEVNFVALCQVPFSCLSISNVYNLNLFSQPSLMIFSLYDSLLIFDTVTKRFLFWLEILVVR